MFGEKEKQITIADNQIVQNLLSLSSLIHKD
jgi:hypothetical protein